MLRTNLVILNIVAAVMAASIAASCVTKRDDEPGMAGTSASGGQGSTDNPQNRPSTEGGAVDAAEAGASSTSGGAGDSGGATSDDGDSGGGASSPGGSEAGQSAGGASLVGDLLGPTTDNQAPVVIDADRRLPNPCRANGVYAGSDSSTFIWCATDQTGYVNKYDAQFKRLWSTEGKTDFPVTAVAVATNGGMFVAGTKGGRLADTSGTVTVSRLDAGGKSVWQTSWTANGMLNTTSIALASDGAVYATGNCSGQAPGNPPEAAGGRWLARFDSVGTLAWIKQYAADTVGINPPGMRTGWATFGQGLALDSSNNLYTTSSAPAAQNDANNGYASTIFEKFDSAGKKLLSVYRGADQDFPYYGFGELAFAPGQKSLYTWTLKTRGARQLDLVNVDLDGSINWSRIGEPARTAVLDPVEQVTWTGKFSYPMAPFAVGANAIYLMGVYDNTYKNGANPPPSTSPVFVARYDLDGARVWFQEFLFMDPTISSEPLSPQLYGAIAIGADGNPLVAINGNNGVGGPYLFKLKLSDGQLLP